MESTKGLSAILMVRPNTGVKMIAPNTKMPRMSSSMVTHRSEVFSTYAEKASLVLLVVRGPCPCCGGAVVAWYRIEFFPQTAEANHGAVVGARLPVRVVQLPPSRRFCHRAQGRQWSASGARAAGELRGARIPLEWPAHRVWHLRGSDRRDGVCQPDCNSGCAAGC